MAKNLERTNGCWLGWRAAYDAFGGLAGGVVCFSAAGVFFSVVPLAGLPGSHQHQHLVVFVAFYPLAECVMAFSSSGCFFLSTIIVVTW